MMKNLLILTLVIVSVMNFSDARRRRSDSNCSDKMDATATTVFTGTVQRLYRSLRTTTYRGVVKVKRVVKGDPHFADNTVIVEGFGDPAICSSDVRERDTRIFVVSRQENGHLRLNSSVVRVTVSNLEKAASVVQGLPLKTRNATLESECERMYCAYGALCLVDKRTQQAHCRCQETCSDIFAPVCGSDGVTYSGECQLRMASCTRQKRIFTKHQGPCDVKDPCEDRECHFGAQCRASLDGRRAECVCPEKCATYGDSRSRPVCGSDGKDYPNVCELRRTSCLQMREIEVRYKGHCDPCDEVKCPTFQVCQLDENRNPVCRCNDACTHDFRPVCGSDGLTYPNECILRVEACKQHRSIRVIYSGDCATSTNPCEQIRCGPGQDCDIDRHGTASCHCPAMCEAKMQPICGSNGRTFDNECELRRQSCLLRQEISIVHEGECGDHGPCHSHHCSYGALCVVQGGLPVCECPTCAEEFEPVCGTDGISYTNPCKLKREACEQKTDIIISHEGLCTICSTQECDFYAVCESFGQGETRCVCPEVCIKVDAVVCGTDGVSYANECELRVEACKKQQYIAVATKGPCDSCEHVHCKNGARCDHGRCVCPSDCPPGHELVCATDGRTYINECEMKRVGCQKSRDLNVQFYGTCGEAADYKEEGESHALKERKIVSCQDKQCKLGGVCDFNSEGAPFCVCTFHCPALKEPVCGSDGRMHDNECRLREEACLLQKRIDTADREACVDHVDIACDGEPPVIDPATGKDYFCGVGPGSKLCPAKTVCHLTQYFAKCCKEAPLIKTCDDTPFGCCPDQRHPVMGPNNGGCPSVCNCNQLGSYSLTCDPVSKQCPCKPGVGGLRCDRCEPGYWGLHKISTGNSGCLHCNCNPYGSLRDDCEQTTGRCVCKHGIQGMKCDICPPGTLLGPDGCMDETMVNATAESCDDLECYHGGHCVLADGVARCSCDFRCSPEDSRDPVCGYDGNTYGSECQMRLFSCRYQRPINIRYYGMCRKGYLSDSDITTTFAPFRMARRRSFLKRPDSKSTRAVTAVNLPQNLYMTTNAPISFPTIPTIARLISETENEVQIPSFSGKSFMEVYKLEAYSSLSVEIEFKTFSKDGLILYNGQTTSKSGDFVSLSIRDGYVEFRYNLGSGPVVLRSVQRVPLGKFQKVIAKRYLKDGKLMIEGQENVLGKSQGTLNYLDLSENLYIGYTPGSSKILALHTGVEVGLNGCIRRLKIDHREANLKYPTSKEILRSSGISECTENSCNSMPCKNGGTCLSSEKKSFHCKCVDGFSGEKCETSSDPCSSNPCGDDSTCTAVGDKEFHCRCLSGKSGKLCEKSSKDFGDILIPDFTKESFLVLPTLQNAFSIEIRFLTRSHDGLIFYNGQMLSRKGDYVSLNLVNGFLNFAYNLGSGSTNITSQVPVSLNKWHSVKISLVRRQGTLKLDNEKTVVGESKRPLSELNLSQPLYIGGVPNLKHVHHESGIGPGFDGSIQRMVVNGDLWQPLATRATSVHGVRNYEGPPCGPCLHGGVCVEEKGGRKCQCPPKFDGKRCEKRKRILHHAIAFNGTTFLSFPYTNTKGSKRRKANRFQIRLSTTDPSGLLFWANKGASLRGDYLAAAIVDGHPELSYNLGTQRQLWAVRSDVRVDDGKWHTLLFHRKKRFGELRVDKIHVVSNMSDPGATDLNTDGTLWIGGSTKLPEGLPEAYYQGFEGCADSIVIDKSPVHHLLGGRKDAQFCKHTKKLRRHG